MAPILPPTEGVSNPPTEQLHAATQIVARVMREHRYSHIEGTSLASCECGVEAPIVLGDWDIRHHISERITDALNGGA